MSDKKEIATLSIKISVDSSDLDKLEAQLKRIEGLMSSTGLKQTTSVGFSINEFRTISSGEVFLDSSSFITSLGEAVEKGTEAIKAQDEALVAAIKEIIIKDAAQGGPLYRAMR
ncbi:hypothetical protein [Providencia sp. PROV063]|uniref:hypothetical protein n=1 Tax=Providencia sp. PROV063 TaxID=2949789 RepID=UPI002349E64A|nr:hypothetical protein [Providencia sp. PROV063]